MTLSDYATSALYEHRFWLQVLGDHARFIHDALSPDETEEIGRANCFISRLDSLQDRALDPSAEGQLAEITQVAVMRAQELHRFKLHLLERLLTGSIGIHLTATFINHMINEIEEYMRVLSFLQKGEAPPMFGDIHHHLMWLPDAACHAGGITSKLDTTERRLIEMSQTFEKQFSDYYLKAVELAGYMRTQLKTFPALSRFNKEVELEMSLFREFLSELKKLALTHEMLSVLSPLMADHMAREECYYMTKLAEVSEIQEPRCDPCRDTCK